MFRLFPFASLFTLTALLLNPFDSMAQVTYYISPTGHDAASGTSANEAWQTINKLNQETFSPGDRILFERGGSWLGMFHLKGSGSQSQSIVIGAYGDVDMSHPVLDGNGYQAALLIYNDSFIKVENLVFSNQASHLDENGELKRLPSFLGETNDWGSGKNVRFGIKVVADSTNIHGIVVSDVLIHDIFPTPTNSNNQHLGYGIKLENRSDTLAGIVNTSPASQRVICSRRSIAIS